MNKLRGVWVTGITPTLVEYIRCLFPKRDDVKKNLSVKSFISKLGAILM